VRSTIIQSVWLLVISIVAISLLSCFEILGKSWALLSDHDTVRSCSFSQRSSTLLAEGAGRVLDREYQKNKSPWQNL
jgi:hypothetical protein